MLNIVKTKQKCTVCLILDKSWDHPNNLLFKELNWLPLQIRIKYHVALLVFKILINLAPCYLQNKTTVLLIFTANSCIDFCLTSAVT